MGKLAARCDEILLTSADKKKCETKTVVSYTLAVLALFVSLTFLTIKYVVEYLGFFDIQKHNKNLRRD